MMPLLNRPVVDYIVQDCIKAGITDIYFVTGKAAIQLRAYYSGHTALEEYLKERDKHAMLESILPPEGINFYYIEQDQTDGYYGTTVPVWLCKDVIQQDEPVLIIMGDQYLYREDGGSDFVDLIDKVNEQQTDAGMVAVPAPKESGDTSEPDEKKPVKGNVDADLVLWVMKEMKNYNKAVIVSGDGDFYSLVEYLDEQNKLSKILAPNAHYSGLFNRYEQYIERLDKFRKELSYYDHKKRIKK